jgi:uncharacterized membrane protein YgcG
MGKIISVIFVACLLSSCSEKIYNSSSWQGKKVTVDGNIHEWSNPLRFYDQETGISYAISNDHYNLYLCCSISNELLQIKILRAGLEFGIDTLGKKSFAVAMKYPIGNISQTDMKANSFQQARPDPGNKPDRSSFKLKLIAEAREIQLVGFKPDVGKFIPLSTQNNSGISAAINFDANGIMNYEAVIPFSTFYKNELTPSDSNKIFNYRIKINPVQGSGNSSYRNSGRSGGGMGGGGMRGGGMRGGGMGGGGMRGGGMRGEGMNENNYQRSSNTSGMTKTTIKLKLAYR